jgi:hypothetical protein
VARFRLRGGPEGNERLTSTTGLVLIGLLVVEAATVLSLSSFLSVHIFLGLLLLPPIALKLGSTGWRFASYYLRRTEYREKGPPALGLRLLAPPLVLATAVLFGTGVAFLVVGHRGGLLTTVHAASFIVWGVLVSVHVLAYLARVAREGLADWRPGKPWAGANLRRWTVVGVLLAGVLVGLGTYSAQKALARHHHHDHHEFDVRAARKNSA